MYDKYNISLTLLFLLAMALIPLYSCYSDPNKGPYHISDSKPEVHVQTRLGSILSGVHNLRKMSTSEGESGKLSGSFFLIAGGVNASNVNTIRIYFSWQLKDKTYAINHLPIEKIRVQITDKENQAPLIKYKWYGTNSKRSLQQYMDEYVQYAVIICKQSDWPEEINLPMNGGLK